MTQLELTDIGTTTGADADDVDDKCCVIVHQPTREELARSVRSCLAHANQIVSGETIDAATRADYGHQIASGRLDPLPDEAFPIEVGGIALGIDSDRQHVTNGVTAAKITDDVTNVVVDSLATLGEGHAEIRDTVETLVNSGMTVHLNDTAAEIDRKNCDALLGGLDSLDKAGVELQREAEIQDIRDWADGVDRDRGRPSLGFTYDDSGTVVPGENYDEVRAVLSMVLDDSPDGLSRRKAAERLGCAPRTIGRALDNLDRYGLEGEGNTEE